MGQLQGATFAVSGQLQGVTFTVSTACASTKVSCMNESAASTKKSAFSRASSHLCGQILAPLLRHHNLFTTALGTSYWLYHVGHERICETNPWTPRSFRCMFRGLVFRQTQTKLQQLNSAQCQYCTTSHLQPEGFCERPQQPPFISVPDSYRPPLLIKRPRAVPASRQSLKVLHSGVFAYTLARERVRSGGPFVRSTLLRNAKVFNAGNVSKQLVPAQLAES